MSQAPTNTLATRNGATPPATAPKPTGALALLESHRDVIAGLLAADKPEHLERFMRSAAFAIARDPKRKLIGCTRNSIVESVCAAAELKLDFTPSLGLAYLVPYAANVGTRQNPKWEDRAQLQIGYRGLVTLAIRAGAVRTIEAHCVYANDHFEHEMGTEPRIVHRRPKLGEQRGDLVGAYAIATMPDGSKQADVMDVSEIESIRSRSKSGDTGPWKTDYPEMAKKTVVKRLCKYLKLTPEIGRALEKDNEDTTLDLIDEAPRPTNTNRLAAVLGVPAESPAPEPRGDEPPDDGQQADFDPGDVQF